MHMRESTVHNLNETTFGKAGQIQCCLNRGDVCMYFYFVSIRKGSELSQLSCKKRMIHRETIRTNFSTLSPYLTPLFSLPEFPLNVNFSPMSFLNFRASNLILRSEVTIKERLVYPTIVFKSEAFGLWLSNFVSLGPTRYGICSFLHTQGKRKIDTGWILSQTLNQFLMTHTYDLFGCENSRIVCCAVRSENPEGGCVLRIWK